MTQLLHEFYAKRACGSKTRFENRERAAVVQSHDGFKLACYHCPVCHGWHLTKRGGVLARNTVSQGSRLADFA